MGFGPDSRISQHHLGLSTVNEVKGPGAPTLSGSLSGHRW